MFNYAGKIQDDFGGRSSREELHRNVGLRQRIGYVEVLWKILE